MKTWKQGIIGIISIIALAFFACDDKSEPDPCNCPVKAHLAQGETCDCGGKDCNCTVAIPIDKTYIITLKDGALVFTVAYKALPSDAEPAYLEYLQTRLGVVTNSENTQNMAATNYLLGKGSSFTIEIEYTGSSYEGLIWNTATKKFNLHNDWISADGVSLSNGVIQSAFNAVETD